MCGICGFFGKKKNKREIVEKMKEKLVHRGPDAQGHPQPALLRGQDPNGGLRRGGHLSGPGLPPGKERH